MEIERSVVIKFIYSTFKPRRVTVTHLPTFNGPVSLFGWTDDEQDDKSIFKKKIKILLCIFIAIIRKVPVIKQNFQFCYGRLLS